MNYFKLYHSSILKAPRGIRYLWILVPQLFMVSAIWLTVKALSTFLFDIHVSSSSGVAWYWNQGDVSSCKFPSYLKLCRVRSALKKRCGWKLVRVSLTAFIPHCFCNYTACSIEVDYSDSNYWLTKVVYILQRST